MYWFKNVMIYRLTKPLEFSFDELQSQLANCAYHPCSPSDLTKFGWTSPLKEKELLHFSVGKQVLLLAQKEEKMIPAQVIKTALDERIEQIEKTENRKLKKIEKQALKDDIIAILLPRAFSKIQQTALWLDMEKNLIYVNAASSKKAEDILALLRKSLGSLPVVPLMFVKEPAVVMTEWIAQDMLPQWLTALDEAELRSTNTQGTLRCKQLPLDGPEIQTTLATGKWITKLALDWNEHLSFLLNEDGSLKRLRFADAIKEQNDDILKEDIAQRFDADFVLMTGILSKLTENLLDELGGEKERL